MKQATALVLLIVWLTACASAIPTATPSTNTDTAVFPPTAPNTPTQPSGTLYAIELDQWQQTLVQIDMNTGIKQPLFQTPDNGWLASFDLLPDGAHGGQLVLAYAPPPPEGEVNFGFTGLYLMTTREAAPMLLLAPQAEEELFFNPVWSADGQSIYFSHVKPLDQETYTFVTTLERLHLATGQIDRIADNAIWPRPSPDGTMLAYVHVAPKVLTTTLVLADPDGGNARDLLAPDLFTAVDAPIFSPANDMVYFSGAVSQTTFRSWWDVVSGVQTAAAHNLPSDWYRVPVAGGEITRLTMVNGIGLYGRFAPDHADSMAFASQDGLYVMSPEGASLEKLLAGTFTDSLAWTR